MFRKKKNDPRQEETDSRQPQGPGLRENSQGFICPMCMEKLKSAEALQVHWESAHGNDFGGSVGTVHVTPAKKQPRNEPVETPRASRQKEPSVLEPYVPPTMEDGGNELDYYKVQLKLATDIINEERRYSGALKSDVARLEDLCSKSDGQAKEELRAMKQMFEQSEESRATMSNELYRLNTDNEKLSKEKQDLKAASDRVAQKAATLSVTSATLQSRLDESQAKVESLHNQIIGLQNQLKDQELKNERLLSQLRQRPALDDVKVLQQELSSLHLLLEQASSDRDKQVQQLTSERDKLSEEKTRLCEQKARIEEQMETLKVETTGLTRKENVAILEAQVTSLRKDLEGRQEQLERSHAQLVELQNKYDVCPKPEVVERFGVEVSHLRAELKEAKEAASKRDKEVQSLQSDLRVAPKQEYVTRLENDLKEVKVELQRKNEEIKSLDISHKQLQLELSKLPRQQELEVRDSRIRQLELDLAAAPKPERVERLEVELKSLRDQLSCAPKQQHLDSLQTAVTTLQASLQKANEQLQEREAAGSLIQEQLTQSQAIARHQDDSMATIRGQVAQLQREKQEVEVSLATTQQENKQFKKQASQLESKLDTKEVHLRELQESIQKLKDSMTQLQVERSELIAKIESGEGVSTALSQLEQEKRSLQEKLEVVYLSQQERAKEYEQKMDALNTKNSQLMDNMEASRSECRSLETQLHKREVTITSLQEKLNTMTTELRNKENLLVQREKDGQLLQGDLKKQLSAALMEVEKVKSQSKELEESITKLQLRSGQQEGDLREQLASIQERARTQMEEMTLQLRAKTKSLEEAHDQWLQERERMEGDKRVLTGQVGVAKEELEATRRSLNESIQSADARQKALNEELERTRGLLTQEIESLRQSFQQQASKLCGTEDQLQITQTKLSEATAQLQLKEEEHKKLQQSCDDLNRQLSEEKASSVAMTSELKAELNKREEKISQLEETTASLEKEQETLKQELVLEQANVASLQAELQEVKRKGEVAVTSLEAKVVSREAELQVQSKALQAQINEHNKTRHQLETKLANQVTLHEEMSAMKHKSDHLEARLKEQLAKAASLEKEVSTLSMYLQQKTSYASSIESELESKREATEALNAEMESNKKKFEEQCEEYESQLKASHQETQDERDRAEALEQELEGARADFEDLNGQLDQMEQKNQLTEEQLNTLREELVGVKTSTSTEILQLDEKLNEVRVECNQLKDSKLSLEDDLKEKMATIQELTSARASVQSELAAAQHELADSRSRWSSERVGLQEDKETLKKQKDEISYLLSVAQENVTKLSSDLSRLESDLNDEKVAYSKKIATLEETLGAKYKAMEQLQQEKTASTEKHLSEQKALINNLSNLRTQLESSKAKVQSLETMVTKHTSTITELEGKARSLEGERDALLEKVVSGEENTHKLSEEKELLSRSVKELTSGLQDLAREHQMLQVFHTRQRDKRWEKDDEVEKCASCASKFSVSNRKHHCRNCGHIFCNDCTSRTANVPTYKKPERVCESCYTELNTRK
eukprot:Em0001g215a